MRFEQRCRRVPCRRQNWVGEAASVAVSRNGSGRNRWRGHGGLLLIDLIRRIREDKTFQMRRTVLGKSSQTFMPQK